MDLKTLMDNLHDEVSCSVCMCTFTDPKQLPCLHSFCLHCLNGIQRTSGVHGKIICPECRRQFQIPGSGNPSELPTNFRINSLLDVLAIKECSTANVKCGNCNKRNAAMYPGMLEMPIDWKRKIGTRCSVAMFSNAYKGDLFTWLLRPNKIMFFHILRNME